MADFTPTQGRYLAFIHAYIELRGYPPAEIEIANAMCVSAPSAHLMVKMLEKKGLILRHPGKARSLQILIPPDEIPPWNNRKSANSKQEHPEGSEHQPRNVATTPANLYVVKVYLDNGPVSEKFFNKECSRVIEIRGDQTLKDLHKAIFNAYDRTDEHHYQFQMGKRPFDPEGPNYGTPDPRPVSMRGGRKKGSRTKEKLGGHVDKTTLDDLELKPDRVFGYWFDFGDNWYHQVMVERIEQAIPTVTYPRVIKVTGKSPPQYPDE